MGVSQGDGFPSGNIGPGAIHVRTTDGLILVHIGGNPALESNWRAIGGVTDGEPDTSEWGTDQEGATWYDRSLGVQRFWNGSASVSGAGGASAWTAFTPTGSWTGDVTYTGFFRTVGQNLEGRIVMQIGAGAVSGTLLRFDITNTGFTIDMDSLPNSISLNTVGEVRIFDNSATDKIAGRAQVITSTLIGLFFFDTPDADDLVKDFDVTATAPITRTELDRYSLWFSVPIE